MIDVLDALGRLLRAPGGDGAAFGEWLEIMATTGDDGPFVDVTSVLLEERHREVLFAAARAWVRSADGPTTRGRAAAGGSVYAPLHALLDVLPDGAGGTLGGVKNVALRKLVERCRARKNNVTDDVARSASTRVER